MQLDSTMANQTIFVFYQNCLKGEEERTQVGHGHLALRESAYLLTVYLNFYALQRLGCNYIFFMMSLLVPW